MFLGKKTVGPELAREKAVAQDDHEVVLVAAGEGLDARYDSEMENQDWADRPDGQNGQGRERLQGKSKIGS